MALLKTEAEKLSNNMLISGVIEEIIDRDELFALMPFTGVNGKAYVYNRENTISEGAFVDPNETITEEASTFTTVTSVLKILAGDVDVDKFLQATMSDHNDQKITQIAAKAKGLGRKFRRTMVIGDSGANAKEFDGVKVLTDASQLLEAGANGNALSLTMLDELLDAIPYGADALMMRSGTWRAYLALLRALGGTQPESVEIENFGRPVRAHNGVPVIINDFLPTDETKGTSVGVCTSIYAMRLNEADGLHGLFGGDSAGIVVEDIGTVQNKDATRTRLKWYCGTALKSTKSLARMEGVTSW